MKVEIGESLILSWLRHIKECQIVQTNWKPSSKWELNNTEALEQLKLRSEEFFKDKYDYDIYKGSSSLTQILMQAEVDVLGVSFENSQSKIYAVDVAFHG